jgi:hypothetical protein
LPARSATIAQRGSTRKRGWQRARNSVSTLETPGGVLEMPIWRYEKCVKP